jgi:hypothetical protein
MKKKIFGFLGSTAFILISATSFAQLGVGVSSATKATTTINGAAVNNAVTKTTTVTNTAVTKVKETPGKTVTKVKEVTPAVNANVGIQTATQVSSASNNSGNQSNGNGNSEVGTTILTSSQTRATVSGDASTKNTTDAVKETKTKVKDDVDETKTKIKDDTKKVKEKVRKQNHGLEVSTEAKAQGEIKRQNQ